MSLRSLFGAALATVLIALSCDAALAQNFGGLKGERYALLIGVRAYETPDLRPLGYSEDDVDALAQLLLRQGYPPENVRLMTQKEGAIHPRMVPSAANIRKELDLFLQQMGPEDRVIVGLAGHGVQFADEEASYFCPADARLQDRSTLIDLGQVHDALKRCGAGFKLLLVDACRNNPLTAFGRDAGRPISNDPSLSRPLKKRPPGGVAVLLSCSGGQRSFEHPNLQHGVFFHFVINGLEGGADSDSDGKVDLAELIGFTTKRVYRYVANTLSEKQLPEFLGVTNSIDLATLPRPAGLDIDRPRLDPPASERGTVEAERAARTPSMTPPRLLPPPGDDSKSITNSVGMTLVRIPAGEFLMGSPDSDDAAFDDEKPQHRVFMSRPFYLGATEVTVGQFRKIVESSGYRTDAEKDGKGGTGWDLGEAQFKQDQKFTWRFPGFEQTDEEPVTEVSWNDAIKICNELSRIEGFAPYYQFGPGARSSGDGYRLPTEAEWEYACRAGTTTRFVGGDTVASLAAYAWTADNSGSEPWDSSRFLIESGKDFQKYLAEVIRHRCRTHPVSRKQPNSFGLYDMHGNVWEWCWDGFEKEYYRHSPGTDPLGASPGSGRVIRGGGWFRTSRSSRSAYRDGDAPEHRYSDLGFRVARGATVP